VAGKRRPEGWGLNGDGEVPVVFQSVLEVVLYTAPHAFFPR